MRKSGPRDRQVMGESKRQASDEKEQETSK
jgi:hypothetical protein